VPGQSSRSLERRASKRERPGRRPLSPCARFRRRSKAFVRTADCADSRMRFQEVRGDSEMGAEGGPASCGPNAEPPFRARVLPPCSPHAASPEGGPGTRRLSHTASRADNASGVEAYLVQSLEVVGGGGRRKGLPPPRNGRELRPDATLPIGAA